MIDASEKFGIAAQIVGKVESKGDGGGKPEVVIRSEYGEFRY